MNKLTKLTIIKDTLANFFSKSELSYIVESADWVIKYVGKQLTANLNRLELLNSRITTSHYGIKNQIVHFGSLHTFLTSVGFRKVSPSDKVILTVYHLIPEDKRPATLRHAQKGIDIIHTSCTITKKELIQFGISKEKIVVIPLGIDLSLFKPASPKAKQNLKAKLGIPRDALVIGSFQKDGMGWGEGLEPKLEKGPDIFVKTIARLSKKYPVFVLLVGPARGYVKKNLKQRDIPFKDIGFLKDFQEITKYYQALDLYLISSRIEGGPLQTLEAWASGIPVVSTRVGMVPDIAKNEEHALLGEVENIKQLASLCQQLYERPSLRKKLIRQGLKEVKNYSWQKITKQYYEKLYAKQN